MAHPMSSGAPPAIEEDLFGPGEVVAPTSAASATAATPPPAAPPPATFRQSVMLSDGIRLDLELHSSELIAHVQGQVQHALGAQRRGHQRALESGQGATSVAKKHHQEPPIAYAVGGSFSLTGWPAGPLTIKP
jgi:hypothetical protein